MDNSRQQLKKQVKKHIPKARMAYLAYMDTIIPPTHVHPDEGVFLEYAPFEKYTAKGENAEELIKREKEMLIPLMQFFNCSPKKVLEYWYDNSYFSSWKKPPKPFRADGERIKDDIDFYASLGFDNIASFACFLGEDYEALHGDVDIASFV